MTTAVGLLILAGVLLYLMTPQERLQLGRAVLDGVRRGLRAVTRGSPSNAPFDAVLRARTRWTLVTPLLAALNAVIFLRMLVDAGPVGDPQTLVGWGGNVGLYTTNGDWWRLVATLFVHAGTLHLFATMAGLVPLGLVLERAVGPVMFLTTYLAAGIIGGVVGLWTTSALSVSIGASGAIFGIYGLLLATVTWSLVGRATVSVPPIVVKRIGAAAAAFVVYNLLTDHLGTASELAGLMTGFVGGVATLRGIALDTPPLHRAAWVIAATMAIAIAGALPRRGIADVAPEIARVVALEERTTAAYDAEVVRFRKHAIDADALVRVIDATILPQLHATRVRLTALRGVPPEHAPLVSAAERYFQLREESWRRRAEGLLQSSTRVLREAEETERSALEALRTLRPAG